MNQLSRVRQAIRTNHYTKNTSGLMPNLVQGNLVIMPKRWADEFIEFCNLNPTPCPIIGVSQPGDHSIPELGVDLDIRVDLPEYHVFIDGEKSQSVTHINRYWKDDFVAMVIGCSFSFEDALQTAGFSIRNIAMKTNVSMYETNIPTQSTPHFHCNTVVSMRPFKEHQIDEVIRITKQFPKAHGAPIHIGDPKLIGIHDIQKPDFGETVPMEDDDIPVFWGCGVTTQTAIKNARLPLVITHAPGKMLITDVEYSGLIQQVPFKTIASQ